MERFQFVTGHILFHLLVDSLLWLGDDYPNQVDSCYYIMMEHLYPRIVHKKKYETSKTGIGLEGYYIFQL